MVESAVQRALRPLRTGYGVAITAMVALMALEHTVVQVELSDLAHDALLVNRAGRQRMLGQQLAKHAALAHAAPGSGLHRLEVRSAFEALRAGRASIAEDPWLDPALRPSLEAEALAAAALLEVAEAAASGDAVALRRLEGIAQAHLRAADAVTGRMQSVSEAKHTWLRYADLTVLGLSVLALLAIVQGLVRPTLRQVNKALSNLERARSEAEAAAEQRARFAANVSHELRTPLNGILGMARFLHKSPLSPRQKRYAEVVSSSAEHLKALVDDILDFSKVQAEAMTIERIEVDLPALVEQVAREQAPQLIGRDVTICLDVDPILDGTVYGDPLRIRQCLTNLVSNAVKFTAEGWVRVQVEREDAHQVRFEVVDTGRGVAADRVDSIFDAFQQEDPSTTREHGGTGLGLAITRKLARLMGGEAGYRPRSGGGSRFFFTARLAPAAPRERVLFVEGAVLLVGLERARRRAIERWLGAWGVRSVVVEAGAELEAASSELGRIALAIADGARVGPNALHDLGARLGLAAERVLVGVAPGQEQPTGDLETIANQTTWPLGRDRLIEALDAEPPETAAEGRRLLLVEDNPINREVACVILEELGFEVEVAVDGRDALSRFEVGDADFDVVLMDWHMPVMDGLEATRRIRQLAAGASVPIVALTAGSMEEARDSCLAAGMNDTLGKPIDPGRLEDVLGRVCKAAPEGASIGPPLRETVGACSASRSSPRAGTPRA